MQTWAHYLESESLSFLMDKMAINKKMLQILNVIVQIKYLVSCLTLKKQVINVSNYYDYIFKRLSWKNFKIGKDS